jgi:peptide chain release factor 1
MISEERVDQILARFEYLEARLGEGGGSDDFAALSREYAELRPVVETLRDWRGLQADLAGAEAMLDDPEMRALAEEELSSLRERRPALEEAVTLALLPKDEADSRAAILEIRAGTGGDEAALFAGDLFRMYQRYADAKGWKRRGDLDATRTETRRLHRRSSPR